MKDYFTPLLDSMTPWRGGFILLPEKTSEIQGNILIFHGITGTPRDMQGLAVYLAEKGFRVFMPRLTGHDNDIQLFRTISAEVWIGDAETALEEAYKTAKGKVIILGGSFGGLLSLYLAASYQEKISSLITLAPPMILQSKLKEFVLGILSYLPDAILNLFCLVAKKERDKDIFVIERDAYQFHAVSAMARVVALRRKVVRMLGKIICPILILQDPQDHHLSNKSPGVILKGVSSEVVEFKCIEGGEHELVICRKYMEVFEMIYGFVCRYK